jgi:hypothetical protein
VLSFLRKKPPVVARPWLGPLATAQPVVRDRLSRIPSFEALLGRGLDASRTLLYVPEHSDSFVTDLYVLGRMFAWDDHAPLTWVFNTVGLCALEQPARPRRSAFQRFELALATNNAAETEDPFPAKIGVALAQEPHSLPGWDWNEVLHPPLLRWFALVGQEFASSVAEGEHFAIPDTLLWGPGRSSWTRSILDHAVLLPATPHMLLSGLSPFEQPGDPADTVRPAEWHRRPGTDQFKFGFYWLLPVSADEHARAAADGTWNLLADLIEAVPAGTGDDCHLAFDLLRGAPAAP